MPNESIQYLSVTVVVKQDDSDQPSFSYFCLFDVL